MPTGRRSMSGARPARFPPRSGVHHRRGAAGGGEGVWGSLTTQASRSSPGARPFGALPPLSWGGVRAAGRAPAARHRRGHPGAPGLVPRLGPRRLEPAVELGVVRVDLQLDVAAAVLVGVDEELDDVRLPQRVVVLGELAVDIL